MANPRQRHKQRTSRSKLTRRTGDKLKKVQIKGSAIIAANWDKTKTLQQNYKRLGLVSNPNHNPTSGGVEKLYPLEKIDEPVDERGLKVDEAIIKRDDAGKVIDIIYSTASKNTTEQKETAVVKALEKRAQEGATVKRTVAPGELEWIKAVIKKYGDNYERAARDRRINPMQQTAADIRRRVERVKKAK